MSPAIMIICVLILAASYLATCLSASKFLEEYKEDILKEFRQLGYKITYYSYSGKYQIEFLGTEKKGHNRESRPISQNKLYRTIKKMEHLDSQGSRDLINKLIGLSSAQKEHKERKPWTIGSKK